MHRCTRVQHTNRSERHAMHVFEYLPGYYPYPELLRICEFCTTCTPVPRTSVSSAQHPYPYPESLSVMEDSIHVPRINTIYRTKLSVLPPVHVQHTLCSCWFRQHEKHTEHIRLATDQDGPDIIHKNMKTCQEERQENRRKTKSHTIYIYESNHSSLRYL